MLEEMRADYDHTQAAFGVMIKAALAEIKCSPELKEKLREAAKAVYECEWGIVRATDLDKYFLTWLCSDRQHWLYTKESCWWYLPQTAVPGLDYLLVSDDSDEKKRGKRMDAQRTERIERAVSALKAGWLHEEAVTFVRSREEWEAAMNQVGLKMDGTARWD